MFSFILLMRDFLLRNKLVALFFILLFGVLITNTLHEMYPDEFDNILGGWYILHGKFLYSDFFSHHNPFPYILSAFIELFSLQSFVRYRLVYALLLFGYLVWTYVFLQRRFGKKDTYFYLGFLGFYAIGATYFWGHMVLADNIAALLLLPVVAFLFLTSFYREKLQFRDVIVISVLTSLAILSSLTFSYFSVMIYAFTLLLYITTNRLTLYSKHAFSALVMFAMPFIIFAIYLFVTGALSDYIYDSIVFNQKFYIYNYPRPEGAGVNPLRYAIVMAYDFFTNFSNLLISVKDFNFSYPFNITLALVNTGLVIYLIARRQFLLAIVMIYFFIYANARTNPLTSTEKDYQSSVYILLSLFFLPFVLSKLYQELNAHIVYSKKLIYSLLLILVGVYSLFTAGFLFRKYGEKTYGKFMGTAPLIYDRPTIAPIMNSLIASSDYMWVGPLEFENLFYTHGKLPSKYAILLPEFAKSPRIQEAMMQDFEQNKPKVIYFDKNYSIRGYQPDKYAQFFLTYLNTNYTNILALRNDGKKYTSVSAPTLQVDLESKLFIRKDAVEEILPKLINANLIRPAI